MTKAQHRGSGWSFLVLLVAFAGGALWQSAGSVAAAGNPDCTPLRWETFARGFFARRCNRCHSWNDYSYVYQNRDSIQLLVTFGDMPPDGRLPQSEIDQLLEWLDCDLPLDGPPCPPGGTPYGFDGDIEEILLDACGSCHETELGEGERSGAPLDQNWDDYASVVQYANGIRDSILKRQMPPDGFGLFPDDEDILFNWIACGSPELPRGAPYTRGDANDDGSTNISDAVTVLGFLFQGGGALHCEDAADVDGDGSLTITDPIDLIDYLFAGGSPPVEPFSSCGTNAALGCERFDSCQ